MITAILNKEFKLNEEKQTISTDFHHFVELLMIILDNS